MSGFDGWHLDALLLELLTTPVAPTARFTTSPCSRPIARLQLSRDLYFAIHLPEILRIRYIWCSSGELK